MLTYRIDEAAGLVEMTGLQTADHDNTYDFLHRILADPAYRPDFGFLRDRRGLPPLSIEDATRLASISEHIPELRGKRWAIVVEDVANYGTSRMQQTIAEWHGLEVRVFTEAAAARAWLQSGNQPTADRS